MVHMSPELVPRAYPSLFTNLRYTVYIYLKKIKIMYFIFVLFFLGHPRHPPPGLKTTTTTTTNHIAGIWSMQVRRQSRSQRQSTSLVEFIAHMKR